VALVYGQSILQKIDEKKFDSSIGKLPSMALDIGIHASMKVLAEVPC